jgi:hypothetical protein
MNGWTSEVSIPNLESSKKNGMEWDRDQFIMMVRVRTYTTGLFTKLCTSSNSDCGSGMGLGERFSSSRQPSTHVGLLGRSECDKYANVRLRLLEALTQQVSSPVSTPLSANSPLLLHVSFCKSGFCPRKTLS